MRPWSIKRLPRLPARKRDGHKGLYGHVLVVGGSRGMIGAPALAANAALRSGAGLVTVAVPEPTQLAVASLCPCATSAPLACTAGGEPSAAAVRQMLEQLAACDVLAMGPGLGRSGGAAGLVRAGLEQDKPVVLDADGLNNLAAIDRWWDIRRCPLVLTPHPGEFARLTGRTVGEIQKQREEMALAAAREWACGRGGPKKTDGPVCCVGSPRAGDGRNGAGGGSAPALVVVLKGAGTVVTDGGRVYVNHTGNPGMATGGTGDVLTGVIAALIGQKLPLFDAACLGAYVHGLAGDLAAKCLGQVALIATDVIDHLPGAFKRQCGVRSAE